MGESILRSIAHLGLRESARVIRVELRRARMRSDPRYVNPGVCEDRGIFIVGCGRSGTTLLRELLDRHSSIAAGPETQFLRRIPNLKRLGAAWGIPPDEIRQSLAQHTAIAPFAGAFMRRYAQSRSKPRWLEKTPGNITEMYWLLNAFPNAVFIHVIRDGRDVVCSRRAYERHKVKGGAFVPSRRQRTITIANEATWWVRTVTAGLAFRAHPRLLEMRYESLLADPEHQLREACAFLGEPFEPAMLDPKSSRAPDEPGRMHHTPNAASAIDPTRTGRWQHQLSPSERAEFHRVAGALLIHLGYEPDDAWVTAPP